MSSHLVSFLKELLEASPCSEINFVQDNSAGPKERLTAALDSEQDEDSSSVSSSCPEPCRWMDSSSSSLSLNSTKAVAPPIRRPTIYEEELPPSSTASTAKITCPRPPRRQVSWDNDGIGETSDLDMSTSYGSSAARAMSGLDMSASNSSRGESVDVPRDLPRRSARYCSSSDRLSLSATTPAGAATGEAPTNMPPRPPPRRTSSRLRRNLLRTLETNLDRFPPSDEDEANMLWGQSANRETRKPSSGQGCEGQLAMGKVALAAILSTTTRDRHGVDTFLDLKNNCLAVVDAPSSSPSSSSSNTSVQDVKKASSSSSSPPSSDHLLPAWCDIAPPRKPRRQVTSELPRQKKSGPPSLPEASSSGDSLHELMRHGRSRRTPAA